MKAKVRQLLLESVMTDDQSQKETTILNPDQRTNVNELNSEKETQQLVTIPIDQESDVPLFLGDSSDGKKGDDQDEKDETEE